MSYDLPEQVLRLVATLRAGSAAAPVLVHHDARRTPVDRGALRTLGAELVEPPSAPAWGEGSQLAMVLRCLRELLRREWDWVVLLSGQDYPIRPVPAIERSLGGADVDAFIEALPVPRPARGARDLDEYQRRYHHTWRPVPEPAFRAAGLAARASPLVQVRSMPSGPWAGVRTRRGPFAHGLTCHRGGDWFTLSRRAAEAVDRAERERPELLRHVLRTLIPTEAYAQTVLANDPTLRLSGNTRRFTSWEPGAARPRVLTLADLPAMRASGFDVARKFDPAVDRAVLDALDREVHGL